VVVVAAEAKTTSRSLIAINDVEGVFNDEIVKELAQTAKLPADADIARFAQSIRISARIFLEAKNKLNFPQPRTAIERLYRLNTRAEDGNDRTARALARAVDAMRGPRPALLTKRAVPRRVRIATCDHEVHVARRLDERLHDGVAARDRQAAARQEVILHIDDNQRIR